MHQVPKSFSALTLRGGNARVSVRVFPVLHTRVRSCCTATLLLQGDPTQKLVLGGLSSVEPRPPARDGLLLIVTIVIPLQVGANSWPCVELRL